MPFQVGPACVRALPSGALFCIRGLLQSLAASEPSIKASPAAPGCPPFALAQAHSTQLPIPHLLRSLQGMDEVKRSWKQHNGDAWEHRFYDDAACLALVRGEYPQYLKAYLALPKDIERSDFFRQVAASVWAPASSIPPKMINGWGPGTLGTERFSI